MQTTGRNDPCPCGSGKKYKKCCYTRTFFLPGPEETLRKGLVDEVLAFTREHFKEYLLDADAVFWDDFEPKELLDPASVEAADINFWEWCVHDWSPPGCGGHTMLRIYRDETESLSRDQKALLGRMNDACLSLYEMKEVVPGESFVAEDLLLGGEHSVKDKAAAATLCKWDLIATRLLMIDGHEIIAGAIYPFPARDKNRLMGYLAEVFEEDGAVSMHEFLKQNGEIFNHIWCENIERPLMPTLVTADGAPAVFAKAFFDIKDEDAVVRGLKELDAVNEGEDGVFYWVEDAERDLTRILGWIRMKGNRLELECVSEERLSRGKKLLMEGLGEAVSYRIDMMEDPYQGMKDFKPSRSKRGRKIPEDLEQEMYSELMQKHYEGWLDMEIPALDGRTPMEAVKDPEGKKGVVELLKGLENMEEHKKQAGEPYFETLWMWERLGIER